MWILRILGLFILIAIAVKTYDTGHETVMAGIVFFIILPYCGMLVAQLIEDNKTP